MTRIAAVLAATLLTASVAQAADSGIELGARTGFAFAGGNVGTPQGGMNEPINNYVAGQFPLWLDLGYRIDPRLYLGGFFSYGFGVVSDENQTTCRETNVSCSASDTRLGVMGRYRFPVTGALAPWFGVGFGYEWGNFTWRGQTQGVDASLKIDSTWSGFEFANLQAGADYHLTPQVVIAPVVSVAIGQFRNMSTKTTTVTPLGTTSMTEDEELAVTSTHFWMLFGLRAAYMP
jgi:opacity protein-like surface antigen